MLEVRVCVIMHIPRISLLTFISVDLGENNGQEEHEDHGHHCDDDADAKRNTDKEKSHVIQ